MVECQLPKLDVAGSNPVSRSIESISYEKGPTRLHDTFSLQSLSQAFHRLLLGL